MLDAIFFYIFAVLTLLGGVLTVTRRNAVHSAISLIVSLLGVAGLYLMQKAEFLFAVQIVLYIGGIMLLFLFVIMLVNLDDAQRQKQFNSQWALALVCVAAVGALFALFLYKGQAAFPWAKPLTIVTSTAGNTEMLADVLFRNYLLPFELASILLLVAVVGCVFMAKKESAAK
jgi:NADH-quinone oxidoreductase subunit J